MSFANPWALPSVVASALTLGLLLYVRVRRPPPALWPSLPFLLLGALLFAVGDAVSGFFARGPASHAAGILALYTGVLVLGPSAWTLALHDAHHGELDLVLLDLNMPGLPADEVYRALRRKQPALPILLSSGHPEEEALARLQGEEPLAFLQKPYRTNVLRRRVRELLEAQ